VATYRAPGRANLIGEHTDHTTPPTGPDGSARRTL